MKRLQRISPILFWSFVFLLYALITVIVFNHRLVHPFTEFAMPDVDTDGGLWYQWYVHYTSSHNLLPDIMNFFAYPFGYDFSILPFSNLIYTIQLDVLSLIGFSWSHLVFVTNISSLITYPLSALGGALLAYYVTKDRWTSLLAGIIFGFSFYHVFMGRGEMSINHIEIIPFYLLSVLYYLDKKNLFSLILSTLLFSILFKADPYYAFFSGIFSVIISAFYGEEKFVIRLKVVSIYYLTLFSIFILTNFNFILSNLYLFNKAQLVQVGRNSIARNELLPTLYYTALPDNSVFLKTLGNISQPIMVLPEAIALLGLIFLKRHRISVILVLCLIISTVLASYIPALYWVNVLYFRYFGMFRGVARMSLLTSLFLGVLVSISISGLIQLPFIKRIKKIYITFFLVFLGALFIINSLDVDLSWTRNSDFSKLAKLYTPIAQNASIGVIATYPMTVNGAVVGCPQGYELLGQIVHNKPFACGASPFSQKSIDYYKKISDITNPQTIDTLTHYGIDTIFITNKLMANAARANTLLLHDTRVAYVGRYTQPHDKGYSSQNDLSRDISVYQIKQVVENNKHPLPLIFTPLGSSSYKKISPYMYVVHVTSSQASQLVLNLPYSEKWELLPGDRSHSHSPALLSLSMRNSPKPYSDYMNGWNIPAGVSSYTIYFAPHALQVIGDTVAYSATILCLIILVLYRPKIVYTKS